jgi:hypothetical protein
MPEIKISKSTPWAAVLDESGTTVAHKAAYYGHLPVLGLDGFHEWGLADNEGKTVAHLVARIRGLPDNFDQYDMVDNNGWTVGHEPTGPRSCQIRKTTRPFWAMGIA